MSPAAVKDFLNCSQPTDHTQLALPVACYTYLLHIPNAANIHITCSSLSCHMQLSYTSELLIMITTMHRGLGYIHRPCFLVVLCCVYCTRQDLCFAGTLMLINVVNLLCCSAEAMACTHIPQHLSHFVLHVNNQTRCVLFCCFNTIMRIHSITYLTVLFPDTGATDAVCLQL